MNKKHTDIVVLGSGMVGMALAHQINEQNPDLTITIDKESETGRHSSGRNSGVLCRCLLSTWHSQSKVCVDGARRLRAWCENEDLPVLACGKVIAPQAPELDGQLEILLQRGLANGAEVKLIDEYEFRDLVPDGRTATGRALGALEHV